MKRLIEFPLDGGGFVFIEVDEKTPGMVPATSVGERIVKATRTFGEALDTIQPIADRIVGKLRDLAVPPDEVNVEFGFTLSAEAGLVVASGSSEANFTVALNWKKD